MILPQITKLNGESGLPLTTQDLELAQMSALLVAQRTPQSVILTGLIGTSRALVGLLSICFTVR